MIQFNLLPDIKIAYLRAQRQKHLVILVSTVAIIASLAVLLLLVSTVEVLQKKSISDLTKDIKSSSSELTGTQDLTKILTVQNQLKSIEGLHDKKAVASRLFTYLSQVTPTAANIAKLQVSFAQNTMSISGTADNLTTVNKFTDTLKFTTFTDKAATGSGKSAFSSVVLSAFNRDSRTATYTITLNFDPTIFSESADVSLTIPNITTTRSEVEQPSSLFQKSTGTSNQ